MCGFVGFTNHIDNSNVVLGEMLDKIKNRGPDAEGTYIDEDIALGHRRLSIIDVSEAGTLFHLSERQVRDETLLGCAFQGRPETRPGYLGQPHFRYLPRQRKGA